MSWGKLMINYEYAFDLARKFIGNSAMPLKIFGEGGFQGGWFSCYQLLEYLRAVNRCDQLAGNSPFLIDRNSGELNELGAAKPVAEYLDDYLSFMKQKSHSDSDPA